MNSVKYIVGAVILSASPFVFAPSAQAAATTTPLQILSAQMLHVNATSAQALWNTNNESVGHILFASSSDFQFPTKLRSVGSSTWHGVTMQDLSPNTQYFVKVFAQQYPSAIGEEARVSLLYFKTLPRASTTPEVSVKVSSPNGGRSYALGEALPIQLTLTNPNGYPVAVALESRNAGGKNIGITGDLFGSRLFWIIPAAVPVGDYVLRADIYRAVSQSGSSTITEILASDVSDATFSILAATTTPPRLPVYTVLSPNGGEVHRQGEKLLVRWSSVNATSSTVTVELYRYDTKESVITTNMLNTGTGSDWTIPLYVVPGNAYKIRVRDNNIKSVIDDSNNTFSILGAITPPAAAPAINVTEVRTSPSKLAAGRAATFAITTEKIDRRNRTEIAYDATLTLKEIVTIVGSTTSATTKQIILEDSASGLLRGSRAIVRFAKKWTPENGRYEVTVTVKERSTGAVTTTTEIFDVPTPRGTATASTTAAGGVLMGAGGIMTALAFVAMKSRVKVKV